MSFWQSVGKDLAKVVSFGRVIAPVAAVAAQEIATVTGNKTVGTVAVDLSLIQGLASTVSGQIQAVGGSGGDTVAITAKLAPLLMQAIENSGFLDGKQVTDVSKWNTLVQEFAAAALNLDSALAPAAPAAADGTPAPSAEAPAAEMPKSEAPTGEIKPEAAPESAPAAAAVAAGAPFKAKLSVVRGGRKGQEFPLEDGNNLIGRWDPETGSFPEVDLDADDPEAKISRKHALIRIDGGKITIEDIGSLNGTYVNRQPRLSPGSPAEIKSGDEVIIGKTFLKLVVEPIS